MRKLPVWRTDLAPHVHLTLGRANTEHHESGSRRDGGEAEWDWRSGTEVDRAARRCGVVCCKVAARPRQRACVAALKGVEGERALEDPAGYRALSAIRQVHRGLALDEWFEYLSSGTVDP